MAPATGSHAKFTDCGPDTATANPLAGASGSRVAVAVGEALGDGSTVGDWLGSGEGLSLGVGTALGSTVGVAVGSAVGSAVTVTVGVGSALGSVAASAGVESDPAAMVVTTIVLRMRRAMAREFTRSPGLMSDPPCWQTWDFQVPPR